MTDPGREAPPDTAQADQLYRGFPDFSAWGELTPNDVDLWSRFASSLEERRKTATPEDLNAAVEVAVRAAALDTGAIEGLYTTDRGFTMTVALQYLAWEQMIEERGTGVRELFEAQLEAYELVLDAVTRKHPITEAWVRALHEKLCGPQKTYRVRTELGWQEQELPKGQYKTLPNHVLLADGSFHAYAPVDRVPDEMYHLLEQIRTPEFETAHPVLQASYLHYAFVVIHPFADGNGRVARALASVFFYRAESIPLVIFANQRPAYIDALALADRGDHGVVISFFLDRGIDTMQLVIENLLTTENLDLESSAERLRRLYFDKKGLSHSELDNVATRLLGEVISEFKSEFQKLDLPKAVSLEADLIAGHILIADHIDSLPRYRRISQPSSPSYWQIRLSSQPPLEAKVDSMVRALISTDSTSPFVFLLEVPGKADRLEIRLEDAYPEFSASLQMRIKNWTHLHLLKAVSQLEKRVGESLKKLE